MSWQKALEYAFAAADAGFAGGGDADANTI
jgi:hypothetical protein